MTVTFVAPLVWARVVNNPEDIPGDGGKQWFEDFAELGGRLQNSRWAVHQRHRGREGGHDAPAAGGHAHHQHGRARGLRPSARRRARTVLLSASFQVHPSPAPACSCGAVQSHVRVALVRMARSVQWSSIPAFSRAPVPSPFPAGDPRPLFLRLLGKNEGTRSSRRMTARTKISCVIFPRSPCAPEF